MRSIVLGYVTFAIIMAANSGCVTSQKTTGFQTNPEVNTSRNQPIGIAPNEKKNGIQKFFSSFTGNKGQKNVTGPRIDPNDATSLQNRPDISPELLVVAGRLSLEKHAWESAESYFTRALKIDPNNTMAQEGLSQVAKARAMGIPSNRNSDANPDNQIKTGAELNQALRNLMPKTQSSNNSFGSNSTSKEQRSFVGLNSADGTRNVMASYSEAKSDLTQPHYPSTRSPAPFVETEPVIEIRSRTRGGKVINPYYRQNDVATVSYEQEINDDDLEQEHDTVSEFPRPKAETEWSQLKDLLSKLVGVPTTKRKPNDQYSQLPKKTEHDDANETTRRKSLVKLAALPGKLVLGETKVRSIRDTEKIADKQSEDVKVVRVIADDSSSRRSQ